MEDITLVLNRRLRNLWLIQGIGTGCIWGATGLEKAGESPRRARKNPRDGKQIGNLWRCGNSKTSGRSPRYYQVAEVDERKRRKMKWRLY